MAVRRGGGGAPVPRARPARLRAVPGGDGVDGQGAARRILDPHEEEDAVGFDGKLKPLESSSIAGLVVKVAHAGGLVTTKSEETSAKDRIGNTPVADASGAGGGAGEVKLAGHFLRGHAGSVAYTLALAEGAAWEPLLGIDRARHTLASFKRSYSRGVVPRMVVAFNRHSRKGKLRFEEASRL